MWVHAKVGYHWCEPGAGRCQHQVDLGELFLATQKLVQYQPTRATPRWPQEAPRLRRRGRQQQSGEEDPRHEPPQAGNPPQMGKAPYVRSWGNHPQMGKPPKVEQGLAMVGRTVTLPLGLLRENVGLCWGPEGRIVSTPVLV